MERNFSRSETEFSNMDMSTAYTSEIVSFQLKISVPVCKTTRSRVSTCKGLWKNKRPQKEEEKTGNTCI